MNAPLMIAVAKRLVERGHAVLRFNFRGTGASSGSHDYGRAELDDVAAAVTVGRERGLPLGLAGWSFGAWTALRWLASTEDTMPYVGIAPATTDLPDTLPAGPKRIILGTREQVIDGEALISYANEQAIDLVAGAAPGPVLRSARTVVAKESAAMLGGMGRHPHTRAWVRCQRMR